MTNSYYELRKQMYLELSENYNITNQTNIYFITPLIVEKMRQRDQPLVNKCVILVNNMWKEWSKIFEPANLILWSEGTANQDWYILRKSKFLICSHSTFSFSKYNGLIVEAVSSIEY